MARNYSLMWAVFAIVSLQLGTFFTLFETIRGQEVSLNSSSFFVVFMVCLIIFVLEAR